MESITPNQYSFFSSTFPDEETIFCCFVDGMEEGESESVISPMLSDKFEIVAEDTYLYNGSFEQGCRELISLGLKYEGPIEDGAIDFKN